METRAAPVPRRNFDGLFVHALKPTGAFAQSLRAIGYDMDAVRESYPLEVWRAALRVACEHAYPDLSVAQAHRALGHRFLEGFAQTDIGRIFAAAAAQGTTERCLSRMPAYWRAGREDIRMDIVAVQDREWRAHVEDSAPEPDFVSGVVEAALRLTRAEPQVELLDRTETRYTLRIRW
jgi:uncharacterized protein (TIGR02265 family)